jgi:hypothetical protein
MIMKVTGMKMEMVDNATFQKSCAKVDLRFAIGGVRGTLVP